MLKNTWPDNGELFGTTEKSPKVNNRILNTRNAIVWILGSIWVALSCNVDERSNDEVKDNLSSNLLIWSSEIIREPTEGSWILRHYKQIHTHPWMTLEQWEVTAEMQFSMLKDLLNDKPKHIFVEWLTETIDNDAILELMKKSIRMMFSSIWDFPTELQKEFLLEYPLATEQVYKVLNPEATIYPTLSPSEAKDIDSRAIVDWKLNQNVIMDEREELTMDYISKFVNINKWEDVVLIYWAAHDFLDDLEDKIPWMGFEEIRYYKSEAEYMALQDNEKKSLDLDIMGGISGIISEKSANFTSKIFSWIEKPKDILIVTDPLWEEDHISNSFFNLDWDVSPWDKIYLKEEDKIWFMDNGYDTNLAFTVIGFKGR